MNDRRFEGIINLYGETGYNNIRNSHILILGIGGVGSWVCEALARSSVGSLTIVDLDDICISNINRQIHSNDKTVGQFKVEAMKERLELINPEMNIICEQTFFNEKSAAKILSTKYDFVVDAIDNVHDKAHIISWCYQNKTKIISIGAAGGKLDPSYITINDLNRTEQDKLLHQVRRRLKKDNIEFRKLHDRTYKIPAVFSTEKAKSLNDINKENNECSPDLEIRNCNSGYFGSTSVITATMGFMASGHILNELAKS
jgi:tRNA A37 threonylcarbamoyladenosine dehydratase